MKKIFLLLIAFINAIFICAESVQAQDYYAISDSSAKLNYERLLNEKELDNRIQKIVIEKVLSRYNSPLAECADSFILVSETLDLDPYLLPSIAGVESGFGKHYIQGTYNPFGWNVGKTPFASWDDSIATVGYALRHKYINRGADNLDSIGHIYAGGSTTWAGKVRHYIGIFEREEAKIREIDRFL